MTLFTNSLGQYSSSLYETARALLRSRNNQAVRAERIKQENRQLRASLEQQQRCLDQAKHDLREAHAEIQSLCEQQRQCRNRVPTLRGDLPLPGHQYGAATIALCLNLARRIGFRPAVSALQIVFEAFGIISKIPTAETIRTWACRAGVAVLGEPPEEADDWIWMVDHSNQVGQEKVLQVLAIRAKDLPPPGQTLAREQLRPLAVRPGIQWKRDDMRQVYRELQAIHGTPKFLLSDGAVELRESADVLQNAERSTIVLGDFKHFAANALERILKSNDRFQSYLSCLGRSRSTVQQTELCHLTPPTLKTKARFMNLGPVLRWGQMLSYQASHPRSRSRQGVTAKRFNEKFGWIRGYREDLSIWSRCQRVIQIGLRLINREGLAHGTAKKLRKAFEDECQDQPPCEVRDRLIETLIEFVLANESKLATRDRAWLSTENMESSFGAFKQLEGQQSKGGLTSLVSAMPMVLRRWDASSVRTCLSSISTKQMRAWVEDNLGQTLNSKRRIAFAEASLESLG